MICPHCQKEIPKEEVAKHFAALGGKATSKRKAAAARRNGRKGGLKRAENKRKEKDT